jgi:hypothetical protein
VLFCTVTPLGLVRLVCQPKLMGTAVKNAAKASALLEALCQQPGVKLAEPVHDGWEVFHQLLRSAELPARLCTDVHLVARTPCGGALVSGSCPGWGASGGLRPSELPKLLIREAHHGPRHRQGQRPIPCIEQIHRSLIAIRIAAGGGHPLQGFQRQLAQRAVSMPSSSRAPSNRSIESVRSGS